MAQKEINYFFFLEGSKSGSLMEAGLPVPLVRAFSLSRCAIGNEWGVSIFVDSPALVGRKVGF